MKEKTSTYLIGYPIIGACLLLSKILRVHEMQILDFVLNSIDKVMNIYCKCFPSKKKFLDTIAPTSPFSKLLS